MNKKQYITPATETMRYTIPPLLQDPSLKNEGEGDIGDALGKESIWDTEEDINGLWD